MHFRFPSVGDRDDMVKRLEDLAYTAPGAGKHTDLRLLDLARAAQKAV